MSIQTLEPNEQLDRLQWFIDHIIFPIQHPQEEDFDLIRKEHSLAQFVAAAAQEYQTFEMMSVPQKSRWKSLSRMLEGISDSHQIGVLSTANINQTLKRMATGGKCSQCPNSTRSFDLMHLDHAAFLIRAQNAGLIIHKEEETVTFESFEVSPDPGAVMKAPGALLISYPGPASQIPTAVANSVSFQEELSAFIVQMNQDLLDSAPTSRKAGSNVVETRATAHPKYITQLLDGILVGMGQVANVKRIQKTVWDDVVWKDAAKPWRRLAKSI